MGNDRSGNENGLPNMAQHATVGGRSIGIAAIMPRRAQPRRAQPGVIADVGMPDVAGCVVHVPHFLVTRIMLVHALHGLSSRAVGVVARSMSVDAEGAGKDQRKRRHCGHQPRRPCLACAHVGPCSERCAVMGALCENIKTNTAAGKAVSDVTLLQEIGAVNGMRRRPGCGQAVGWPVLTDLPVGGASAQSGQRPIGTLRFSGPSELTPLSQAQ